MEELEERKAEMTKMEANLKVLTDKYNQLQQKYVGLEVELKEKVCIETDLWTYRLTDTHLGCNMPFHICMYVSGLG